MLDLELTSAVKGGVATILLGEFSCFHGHSGPNKGPGARALDLYDWRERWALLSNPGADELLGLGRAAYIAGTDHQDPKCIRHGYAFRSSS